MRTECQSCDESDKSLEKFVTWKHVELYIEYFPRFFYIKNNYFYMWRDGYGTLRSVYMALTVATLTRSGHVAGFVPKYKKEKNKPIKTRNKSKVKSKNKNE